MTWSLAEYVLHRFAGHAPRPRRSEVPEKKGWAAKLSPMQGDFGAEHQAHHTDTRYFTPTHRKVLAASIALGTGATVGALLVGPRRALSFVLGFGAMYTAYEVEHRRTHTHAPRGAYTRWTRRHHLYHHFGNPKMNHGVTSPIWDRVFGTYVEPGVIRVPVRHAPLWLLDESGEVRAPYRGEYELAGVPRAEDRAPAAAG
jgi:hypothetical protein